MQIAINRNRIIVAAIVIGWLAAILATGCLVVVLLHLFFGFFHVNTADPASCSFLVAQRFDSDMVYKLLVAMGLVNFTYSYIISARDKELYGVKLRDAMFAAFPYHGFVYLAYTLMILIGIYCACGTRPNTAIFCFFSAMLYFISNSITAALFAFNNRFTVSAVEDYLIRGSVNKKARRNSQIQHWKEKEKVIREKMLLAAEYIRQYYTKRRSVPESVVRMVLAELRDMPFSLTASDPNRNGPPFLFYNYGRPRMGKTDTRGSVSKLANNDSVRTVDTLVFVRSLCNRLFSDLDRDGAAELMRQLILSLSKFVAPEMKKKDELFMEAPREGNWPDFENDGLLQDFLKSGVLLCGFLSYSWRSSDLPCASTKEYYKRWLSHINSLFSIMISYPADDSEGLYSVPYNLLLRFFFLLVGACVIAESAVLDIDAPDDEVSEFWGSIKEYMTSAKVSMEWIPWFLAWGQGVMLSANIKWYKPERYCMGIYRFCERISYLMRSPSGY